MSNDNKELRQRVSMLLDGELNARDNPRLIEKIESDEALREAWARYNLIGQAMRAPAGLVVNDDFARRVNSAIREEPAILAPRGRSAWGSELRQRAIGFAMAASLAVVAVMVGKSVVDHGGELYANLGSAHAVASVDVKNADNLTDAQFDDYLLTHNETAYLAGSAGMLPYVRSVSAGGYR